jgi:hypothetical protein
VAGVTRFDDLIVGVLARYGGSIITPVTEISQIHAFCANSIAKINNCMTVLEIHNDGAARPDSSA